MKTLQMISIYALLLIVVVSCGKKEKQAAAIQTKEVEARALAVKDSIEKSKASERDTFLFYQRGACFGMCPIFDLVIYTDGQAIYEGKNFVDMIGFYQTKLDPAVLQKILNRANSIGYFGLEEKYDNDYVTDLPTTVTGILYEGKLKLVHNRYKGPAVLKTLYDEIDKIITEQKWQPTSNNNNHK